MKKLKLTEIISLKNRLAETFADLRGISNECTENELLQILGMLGASEKSSRALISMMRYFDPEAMKFKAPKDSYTHISRMGREWQKWSDFQDAIDNFVSGQKGAKGGLKRRKSQIKEYKEERVLILKDYLNLKYKQNLSKNEKKTLNDYELEIPEEIKSQFKSRAITRTAVKWMAWEFGCSESTLQQILYRKK